MVLDQVRVDAFARAIAAVVKPGDVVVDVGSGTGLLALLAARAGAGRVYAVERGPMVDVLAHTIEENGAGEVVRLVFGEARDAEFDQPPGVIVSETLGSLGLDEDCLALLMAVRSRCAPGCVVIPSRVEVVLALVDHPGLARKQATWAALGEVHGVRLDTLRRRLWAEVARDRVSPADLATTELVKPFVVGEDRAPATLSGTVTATRDGSCNAIAGWFRAELAPGVSLSNAPDAPATCWSNLLLPLGEPLPVKAGEKVKLSWKPRVIGNPGTWAWSATAAAGRRAGDALGPRRGG